MLSHTATCLRLCSLLQSYREDEITVNSGCVFVTVCFPLICMTEGDVMSPNCRLLLCMIVKLLMELNQSDRVSFKEYANS